jgi:DMSO/TMAO reductase YedYZ molybdopterin-dependent catalytic subunit
MRRSRPFAIRHPDRRSFLTLATGLGALALGGCDRLSKAPRWQEILASAEPVNQYLQRLLGGSALAREYSEADLSPMFRTNGTSNPGTAEYAALADDNFANWRLLVEGQVDRPEQFSLADLRAFPARTQITRHDCVEGWSCIGKWTGVPLSALLQHVRPLPQTRYVVFHCADSLEPGSPYYESIDFFDALHPQTILAYEMNGRPLPIGYGAPLRLRLERQLGYKMAKYIMRVEVMDSVARIGRGKGGFWEDRDYEWYAGI